MTMPTAATIMTVTLATGSGYLLSPLWDRRSSALYSAAARTSSTWTRVDRSSDREPSLLRRFGQDCIIATRGYDFRVQHSSGLLP